MKKYNLVASGGTFDNFHKGHEEFLLSQLEISNKIILGITSANYFKSFPKNHEIEPYHDRKRNVEDFLKKINSLEKVDIHPIDSPDHTDLSEYEVEAIIVTKESKKGADLINIKRIKSGLPKLKIINIPLLPAEDSLTLSSTRVRLGEVDREGNTLIRKKWLNSTLHLPEELRNTLKIPFGFVIKNNKYDFSLLNPSQTITVGDISTKTLLEYHVVPKVAVIDLVVEREKKFEDISEIGFTKDAKTIDVINKKATISSGIWPALENAILSSEKNIIKIIGEEDLIVLPVILLAPVDWKVFYGQPGEGLVEVIIDLQIKQIASSLLKSFT